MRFAKTTIAAAVLSTAALTATAGGLAPAAMDTPVAVPVVVDAAPVAAGSINSGYVVLGLLAALVAASGSF